MHMRRSKDLKKAADDLPAGISPDISCSFFSEDDWSHSPVHVPCESSITIYVNDQELATLLCTPSKINCLVIGFLYSEGIITNVSEVTSMRICEEEPIADVRISNTDFTVPSRRTLTSGCGGGVSFNTEVQKVNSDLTVTPQEVLNLMKQMLQQQTLFQQCGGLHCSALCDRSQVLVAAEDIGRHNTLDKILGECLLRKIQTRDRILLTTGRISSEMLIKAAKMQVPVVVSRSSPTERAVSLGRDLNITVVGYARGNRLSVFCGKERFPVTDSSNPQNHNEAIFR